MERSVKESGILKSISGVMICTLLYKFLGFVRELVLSYYFGTSGVSDAYLVSQTIPSVVFEFVGAGVSTCFIPIFFRVLNESGKDAANEFTNKITTMTLSLSTIIIVGILLFAPYVVKVFAVGFYGETLSLASGFTRICILSLYFSTFVFIYGAYLYANKVFMPNAVSAVALSVIVLLSIFMGAKVNIWLMSIGSCLAVGARLLFIMPATRKIGLRTRISLKWRDSYVRDFFYLMIPVIIGTSVNEINVLVDRTIASQLAVGGISALTYANSMMQLANGGIVQPFSTVIFPQITDYISRDDSESAVSLLKRMINVLLLLLVPITFGILTYSKQVIQLLFSRGSFDDQALNMTASAFKYYAFGLCFIGLREIISRLYYAEGDTKTPTINSTIGLVVNIVLNVLFSRWMGLSGLALATSVSAVIIVVLLWIGVYTKLKITTLSLDLMDVAKTFIASVIMVVVSRTVFNMLSWNEQASFLVSVLIAVGVYFVSLFVLRSRSMFEAIKVLERYTHN